MRKIFIDCTHTFFFGWNTGIQRVVRNIITTVPRLVFKNANMIPMIWIGTRFITVPRFRFKPFRLLTFLKNLKIWINPILDVLPNVLRKHLRNVSKIIISFFTNLRYIHRRSIKFKRGDIIFLPDATWNIASSILWGNLIRLKRRKVMIGFLFCDIIPLRHPEYFLREFGVQFGEYLRQTLQIADFFIAISNTVREDIISYAEENNLRVPQNEFNHLGANLDLANSQLTERNNNLGQLKNLFKKPSYIFVSTIEPRKNHGYAISAFEILWAEKDFPGQLIIIGRLGWLYEKTLERILSHPEYKKRLFMINDVSDSELSYAYKNARGLIFTSYCEGFGLPIIEGLSFNLPVFVSDIPVHREIGLSLVHYCDLSNPRSLTELIYQDFCSNQTKKVRLNQNDYSWETSTYRLIQKIITLSNQ